MVLQRHLRLKRPAIRARHLLRCKRQLVNVAGIHRASPFVTVTIFLGKSSNVRIY